MPFSGTSNQLSFGSLEWLSAHLFYTGSWNEFLVDQVFPFCQECLAKGWIRQYFFIRYGEQGPHIRLRVAGEAAVLDAQVWPALHHRFSAHFQAHPSHRDAAEPGWLPNNSVQLIPYVPEFSRYGGPVGVNIAEQQFYISSEAVLQAMAANPNWFYSSALATALCMHITLGATMGLTLRQTQHFFSLLLVRWLDVFFEHTPAARASGNWQAEFARLYSAQRAALVPFVQAVWEEHATGELSSESWLNSWQIRIKAVVRDLQQAPASQLTVASFYQLAAEGVPGIDPIKWGICGSYVHMTNNRLGILNQDEVYLCYLLRESLSEILTHAAVE